MKKPTHHLIAEVPRSSSKVEMTIGRRFRLGEIFEPRPLILMVSTNLGER